MISLGIDIGGTKIALHAVDQAGSVLWAGKYPTQYGRRLIPHLCSLIRNLLHDANISTANLQGIGIGVPGQIDTLTGDVDLAINLNIDQPLPLGHAISEQFETPTFVENDVHLATIGVQQHFGLSSVAYISVGTGVAAGFVFSDQPYRGVSGMAGEVGQVIEMHGNDDYTTLEHVIAGPGIVRQALSHGLSIETPRQLFQLAVDGNATAIKLSQQIVHHMTRTIQWLALVTDVEQIVLGGGVVQSSPHLSALLQDEFDRLWENSKVIKKILTADKIKFLPDDFNPGLWGAIYLVQHRQRSDSTTVKLPAQLREMKSLTKGGVP